MAKKIKLISWNVNGIRAALRKGMLDFIHEYDPDILCLQETKAHQDQVEIDLPGYIEYWNSAAKKGYAGTAIFSKQPAIKVINNIVKDGQLLELADEYGNANNEGRVVVSEFANFFVVSVYTPNSKRDLSRLEFRHQVWDPAFLTYMQELSEQKPLIFCGDLNVAHQEIDLTHPETNHHSHGFTAEERAGFDKIVAAGFIDSYRLFHPDQQGAYTWWAPFGGARAKNVGWRIDYCCVSESLKSQLVDAFILPQVLGSDHCPVGITLELE